MRHDIRLGLIAGAAALGTAGGTLALYGVGVPVAVGALALAALAGLVVRQAVPHYDPAIPARVEALEEALITIRHDVRGALSPALMITDRLIAHADPAVVRAGQIVSKSVDRATVVVTPPREPTPPARP